MLLLYLDEFGHPGVWNPTDPRHRHHPLFGLGGVVIPCARARDLDRGYFRLKTGYYAHEVERAWQQRGIRAERYEPKDMSDRRDLRFATDLLYAISEMGGRLVAHGIAKEVGAKNHNEVAFYNSIMQGILRSFNGVITELNAASGIIIADRRSETTDTNLLGSAQSYLFSHPFELRRVAETPLLVRSDWHHGVQAADTIGRVLGGLYRYRAAGELAFQKFEKRFGALVDSLAVPLPKGMRSVYIRRRTRKSVAAPVV